MDYGEGMLTVAQVAKRLGISHTSARWLVDLCKIPSTVHPKRRCLLVSGTDLEAYMQRCKVVAGVTLGPKTNQYRGYQPKRQGAM